ncbi:PLD nuclease N-terminal domain-containing protein [Alienimonas chondri]|uniref:Cardiolipin synthase N-terminal domain-containing protein n=1 Tax=Alienimonas chondri TaxID=2681879 RepID=A0ABX1VAZ0_9PLAN|nr:PLD nuclease N-terminal domain-containing protein [Alienimonas chondri]NNJ24933.1 hypothetical protein [Alienimonas chondri]
MSLAPLLSVPALVPMLAQVEQEIGVGGAVGGGLCFLLIIAFAILSLVAFVWAIVDIAKREDLDGTMKLVWILVVLFTGVLGAVIYYFVGRSPKVG